MHSLRPVAGGSHCLDHQGFLLQCCHPLQGQAEQVPVLQHEPCASRQSMLALPIRSPCRQQRASAKPHDACLLQCHMRVAANLQDLLVQGCSKAQLTVKTPPCSSSREIEDMLAPSGGADELLGQAAYGSICSLKLHEKCCMPAAS